MRAYKLLLLFFFISSVIGSAQETIQPSSPDAQSSKATVYIYRYKQFVGSALEPSVYCDNVQLARMDNGRYFAVKLGPGSHVFRSNDKQSGVELQVKPGEHYFIRVEIATGFMKGHGRLILTASDQGRYELSGNHLKPLDPGKVVDKERVSVEEAKIDSQPATPVAARAPKPVPQLVQTSTPEHSVPGETISNQPTENSTGDQISLGEAARRARQKKTPTTDATTAPQ